MRWHNRGLVWQVGLSLRRSDQPHHKGPFHETRMITDIVAIVPLIVAPALPRTMHKPAPGNTVDNIEIRALNVVVLYHNLLDRYREVGMA